MIGLHGATTRNPVCLPVCPVNRTRRVAGWVGGPDHPWCMADLFVVLLRILADIDTESLSIVNQTRLEYEQLHGFRVSHVVSSDFYNSCRFISVLYLH